MTGSSQLDRRSFRITAAASDEYDGIIGRRMNMREERKGVGMSCPATRREIQNVSVFSLGAMLSH